MRSHTRITRKLNLALLIGAILPGCSVGGGPDLFEIMQTKYWRVEEQTENGDWRVVGTARFELEEHCLAVIDETQRCRERL